MKRWWKIVRDAAVAWFSDNAFAHAAAVSFYTVFSLAPITLIVVAIVGIFFGQKAAQQQFLAQVSQLVGRSSAELIQKAMTSNPVHANTWVSTVVGAVLLVIGATTVFAQLQQSLNHLWHVTTKPSTNTWLALLLKRLLSFAMVLTIAFLLLASLIITTLLSSAMGVVGHWVTIPGGALRAIDLGVGVLVIAILFTLMFKVLPDVRIGWREALGGGSVTALLFTAGRFGIALYLGHTTLASSYGAAGSLVALLLWIYYSCAIVFFGVEFVRAHRLDRGLPIEPKATAVLVHRELDGRAATAR
jgi:membrane protein